MDNTTAAAAVDGNPDDMPYSGSLWKSEKRRKRKEKETSEIKK